MSFVQTIFEQLAKRPQHAFVTEIQGEREVPASGETLADLAQRARATLRAHGVTPGDRVVLLAPNSIRWVAADLAMLAEGAIAVPMYARQAAGELVEMMNDCTPSLVLCATPALAEAVSSHWEAAPVVLFDALFAPEPVTEPPLDLPDTRDVTIIFTSGGASRPKGVVTTAANTDFMLQVTLDNIAQMLGQTSQDRVFHYLPFCFAGSRIMLWSQLLRANGIMVSTNLDDLVTEFKTAAPHYYLNVPLLLERIKNGVEAKIRERAKPVQALYDAGKRSYFKGLDGPLGLGDRLALRVARRVVFSKIRDQIGLNLKFLVCGSAPLGEDTQRWFEMLDIPVYQIYGLTETTAITTIDQPGQLNPGRVGPAIRGAELRLGAGDELQIRGPHIFSRYWERPEATAEAFTDDGWFRSGDQAEVDGQGNWRIVGRVRNLLVLSTGNNVPPEPIEQSILERTEGVEHAMLVGHGRAALGVLITGTASRANVQATLDEINADTAHYKRVRHIHMCGDAFAIDNGLLTANSKLKRKAVLAQYEGAIEAMYGG